MEIKIRQHIRNNFKDSDTNEIKEAITSSIDSEDEVILPGLGVFFEILWNGSDEESQTTILNTIHKSINEKES